MMRGDFITVAGKINSCQAWQPTTVCKHQCTLWFCVCSNSPAWPTVAQTHHSLRPTSQQLRDTSRVMSRQHQIVCSTRSSARVEKKKQNVLYWQVVRGNKSQHENLWLPFWDPPGALAWFDTLTQTFKWKNESPFSKILEIIEQGKMLRVYGYM